MPNLRCDLPVRSGFSERDREQRVPDLALKRRPGKIQHDGKRRPLSGKVLRELSLGLDQHRMAVVFDLDVEPNTSRALVLPEDPGQPFGGRNQREFPDRGIHDLVRTTLPSSVTSRGHGAFLLTNYSCDDRPRGPYPLAVFGRLQLTMVMSENGWNARAW
jgi:hypothetical protein